MEDNCPPTPLHIRSGSSKSPNQMTVSSPDSDGLKSPSGRLSPDSRCVICLGKLQKKSFTDSCLHQFCFQCLLQWSKVKPECPLCKQPFKSIIHNVRSNCDYDQYHIERREPAYVVSEILHSYDFDLVPVDRRFRYRSTMTREYFGELAESFLTRTRTAYQVPNFVPPPTYHIPSSGRFSPVPERRAARGGSDFRRHIYEQDLWVQDLVDITGRYRECTPQFYRENPAQIHRIIPWLNREINSLLNDYESYTSYVLDRIVSLLPQYSIRSREFREAVEPYFGCRTDHFIHELYTFARSVYDITGFDQNAVYALNPNYATEVQEISSSNDDSEIEVIGTLTDKAPARSTRSRRNKFRKSTRGTLNGMVHSMEPVAGPSGINSRVMTETIDVCESDFDDVKIIEYVKPEPEVVVVSSGDEQTPSGLAEGSSRARRSGFSDDSSSERYVGKQSKSSIKRGKRHKNVSEKGKSDGLRLKGKQKKNMKMRRKRNSSCSSLSSSEKDGRHREISLTLSSFSSSSSSSASDTDSSVTIHDGSSSSDYEPISKLKKKKVSKGHNKKCKKSDRKSLVKSRELKGNDLNGGSNEPRKKTKVKSCVVIPSSTRKKPSSEASRDSTRNDGKSKYAVERRSDNGVASPLPSYWSLMLDNRSEKHKKRKRSKERRASQSNHKASKSDGVNEDDKSQIRKRVSLSPGRSNTNDSLSDSTDISKSVSTTAGDYIRTNSSSVKSENSVEITGESKLNAHSDDEKDYRRHSQSRQMVSAGSSLMLPSSDDPCNESRTDKDF